MILVTGYWMLGKRVACVVQAFAPRVALLLFIKSTEYIVNPVSSIQNPESWSIDSSSFCPNIGPNCNRNGEVWIGFVIGDLNVKKFGAGNCRLWCLEWGNPG